jgi:hypothetical protein
VPSTALQIVPLPTVHDFLEECGGFPLDLESDDALSAAVDNAG